MDLIIDASILFTALVGTGVTKEIIFSDVVVLYAPEFLFDEIEEHKSRIKELSGLSEQDINELLNKLKSRIVIVPKERFERFLSKANSLISDKGDTEYLSLSLSMSKTPIWSNDPHFKEQSIVEVLNTKEIRDKLCLEQS